MLTGVRLQAHTDSMKLAETTIEISKIYIDTKQSNKGNNQNSKDKRQDYNMK